MKFCDGSYLLHVLFFKDCINIQFLCIKSQTERQNGYETLSEKEVGRMNSNVVYIREFFESEKCYRKRKMNHRDFSLREASVIFNVC